MKRFLLLALSLCLGLCVLLCSCKSADTAPTGSGALTRVTDSDGNTTGFERRYLNANGDITRWDVYDKDQVYLSYVLYAYDDADRLYSETYYLANGIAQSRTVYTYDDNGALTEKAFELPNGEATVERYDEDGNVIEKLYYGSDEKLSYREVLQNGEWATYPAEEIPAE